MVEKYMLENGLIGEYVKKLLLTYVFAFIGAIPIIKKGTESLTGPAHGGARTGEEDEFTDAHQADEDGFHLYLPDPSWCREYEIIAPGAAIVPFAGAILLGSLEVNETYTLRGVLVLALMAAFFMLFIIGRIVADSDKEKNLALLRTENGELWCMCEDDLDGYRDYRFNGYPFGAPAFSSEELYRKMKQSAKDMTEAAREGEREAFREYRMMPRQMNRIRLEKEKVTAWKIVYTDQTDQQHKLKLPKIYKDLRIQGSDYCPQGPIRDRRFPALSAGICLAVVAVGLVFIR